MKILVTNDDGINAPGLWKLVGHLKGIGDVTVVAPDREQSGVGTSMSFHNPVRFTHLHDHIHGVPTYSVEGTPADCVLMAIKVIMKDGVDLIFSGMNQGPNCGYDVFLSGTVGAALQGFFYSFPSVAISMDSFSDPVFETGSQVAALIAGYVKAKNMKGKMLLNVNVPSLPVSALKGVDVTRLGEQQYTSAVEKGNDGRHDYYWIRHSTSDITVPSGTDLWALKNRRVSITPLRFNRSEYNTDFVHEIATEIKERLLNKELLIQKEG